ncbi:MULTISPECIES: hypothetical protein [Rhodococcus]|uniref:hypothetical protein n=1 Tax=Rhodococcus TaxID=1827 RepID=UPI000AC7B855
MVLLDEVIARGLIASWAIESAVSDAVRDLADEMFGTRRFWPKRIVRAGVNMFLFPSGLLLGGDFTLLDYLIWNEIPTVLGDMVGGLVFTGLALHLAHRHTSGAPVLAREAELETR